MNRRIRKCGEFVRLLRTEAGITSAQLSQATGRDIADLEAYPQEIDIDDFIAISEALGIDPTDAMRRFIAFNLEPDPS